ncbi:hypothetical protein ZIOFF_031094 [Zingiber officinale]|uniref:Phosphatidate cytidylyltransferase n=1 Tax=Zingiber officinale TaxID=94328 RepID=A0A8J5HA94_ZINOF|nr:hypothetical protein ZIOFF_031094 [Zingiber officinale]
MSSLQRNHSGKIRHRRHSTEAAPDVNGSVKPSLLVNDQNKYKTMLVRAHSSLWMLLGFALVIYMGHLYICAFVVGIQIIMARELFALRKQAYEDKKLPGFRILIWYFFFTAMLFAYGRFISRQLVNTVTSDKLYYKVVSGLVKYQMVICYFLYIAEYRFLLPASLIAINDVAAYFFGFFFGRTPLIKLSPKKTWEGFIGASFATIISAFVLADILGRFRWLTCPRKDLSTGWLHCDPGLPFKPESYPLPGWFPWKEWSVMPIQWHALALGLFASIIAPFGGFFASGLKRAFKIKDFGDSIPGHGGFTDRMDCQMMMAVFAYIYHQSFVTSQGFSVELILDQIINHLTDQEQHDLHFQLGKILRGRLEELLLQ